MKTALLFITVALAAISLWGCAVANGVRYKLAPPTAPATSPETSSRPLDRKNTEILIAKAHEIAYSSLPEKLDPAAKIRGKISLITKSETQSVGIVGFNYNGDNYSEGSLGVYGFKKEDLAVKPDEIQTVILKACDKGKQIGRYTAGDGSKIPAYALDCRVSIIDYRSLTVIAQKKFSGKQTFDEVETSKTATEWIAPEPSVDMFNFIEKFPRG